MLSFEAQPPSHDGMNKQILEGKESESESEFRGATRIQKKGPRLIYPVLLKDFLVFNSRLLSRHLSSKLFCAKRCESQQIFIPPAKLSKSKRKGV